MTARNLAATSERRPRRASRSQSMQRHISTGGIASSSASVAVCSVTWTPERSQRLGDGDRVLVRPAAAIEFDEID